MNDVALALCLIALALIALLPRIFFRRGRLNARWWLTAAPFALSGGALVASIAGVIASPASARLREILAWPAIAAAVAGVALIRWTLHTHARPVSLWHQQDDRPDELVTRGAYAHVRHPFYASFLLVLAACALALPHALTLLALVAGFAGLDRTAAREERRLLEAFGHHYAEYMRRTGRFMPRGVDDVASGRRNALRPPMAVFALLIAGATGTAAQEREFSAEPPADDETTIEAPADPSRLRALRMPELPDPTAPRRQESGLFDAIWTGALFGLGTGLVLTRDDAPPDVVIGGAFGGAAGAATAYATGFSNHQTARSLLGSLAGTAAGVGVGYALANAEVDGVVVLLSSSALGAMFGAGVSWLLDGN